MNKYMSLKGDFHIAERDANGAAADYITVGNTPAAQMSMTVETVELKSSGNTPGTLASEEVSREAELSVTFNNTEAANLARVLYGPVADQAAAQNVAVNLGDLAAGQTVLLPRVNVTAGAFTKTGAVALVEGTDYVLDKVGGMFKALVALTGVSGTVDCAAAKSVGILANSGKEYAVRFVSNKGVVVDLYRWKPAPATNFALISDEFAAFEVSGKVLVDETKPENAVLGRYGAVYRF